jgi:hypothetical protein
MMEAIRTSEPSVFTRAKRRPIPEAGILQHINKAVIWKAGSISAKGRLYRQYNNYDDNNTLVISATPDGL